MKHFTDYLHLPTRFNHEVALLCPRECIAQLGNRLPETLDCLRCDAVTCVLTQCRCVRDAKPTCRWTAKKQLAVARQKLQLTATGTRFNGPKMPRIIDGRDPYRW